MRHGLNLDFLDLSDCHDLDFLIREISNHGEDDLFVCRDGLP